MDNLAPDITRQRLLIEEDYSAESGPERVECYLVGIARHLGLRHMENRLFMHQAAQE